MTELLTKGQAAKAAAKKLSMATTEQKNRALAAIADQLLTHSPLLIQENEKDLHKARENNTPNAIIDRIALTEKRIQDMAEGLRQVMELPDPVGETIETFTRPNGLVVEKVRVPLGVAGIIYEARPNVTVDAAALCLKTGNAAYLRGSSSALHSNKAIIQLIQDALEESGLPREAVQLLEDTSYETSDQMLRLNQYVDVLIPRGGAGLISHVVQNATVPVLETGVGNCHVYIDESAQVDMALDIIVNAKTHRPAVCNTVETLLVNQEWAATHLPKVVEALQSKGVELRACEKTLALSPALKAAEETDWGTEYLDLILAVKTVDHLGEAIEHIEKYGSGHSECIVTEKADHAERFLREIDAAAVYHNASTRFTDGFEFGFGAEIGISTQKLHARGPMGLKELTSYKYLLRGQGQIRN
ncbi:glutamate-5-semialdehyde dehydrogenase [Ammoniphilus sp. CFH 90114]|uniref:glutamate-5-semialdehyde dehydrogenase n=1 Tax=Ammoniphilus sp. CFH 90114 TaxID=2493665 RepID=UPI00100E21D7|nr:glutamate-5-semialdehyde dehydrogenase [Ammoniphilus sp. CFH 90114]RXT05706.1 glutamate-5-semialdehyde dehydrogenase [Ammoniphilus sp. CFH 90114]